MVRDRLTSQLINLRPGFAWYLVVVGFVVLGALIYVGWQLAAWDLRESRDESHESCRDEWFSLDCSQHREDLYLGILGLFAPLEVFFACGIVAHVVHKVRKARYRRVFAPKLAAAKDWYAHGLVHEGELEGFRRIAERLVAGDSEEERVRLISRHMVPTGVVLALYAGTLWVFVVSVIATWNWNFERLVMTALVLIWTPVAVAFLAIGIPLQVAARKGIRKRLELIEESEANLARLANQRSRRDLLTGPAATVAGASRRTHP